MGVGRHHESETTNPKKVRNLLGSGRAEIVEYRPYMAIRLNYTPKDVVPQKMELSVDAGSEHIGISLKTEKHEYISEQRDNLPDEKEKHDDQVKIRRSRRNRKRHRQCRPFHNNHKKGWFAPSIRHKMENHLRLIKEILAYCPVADIWLEVGSFDTQLLEALETGAPLPEGKDYQHGSRYPQDTLREAVFYRDGYKCLVCGKVAFKDHVALKVHHLGFRKKDHSDRMKNLATVCEYCHTPANHKEGGELWNFKPKLKPLNGAAFMNAVRWRLLELVKAAAGEGVAVHPTYGAKTKRVRKDRNLHKSHANDAYCIGELHPKHRTPTRLFEKNRRNNRCLQKFYDAKYVDLRDRSIKKGAEIGCNRDNRKHPRNWEHNERMFRANKVSKGSVTIRRNHYEIRPGDPFIYIRDLSPEALAKEKGNRKNPPGDKALYTGKRLVSGGVNNKGKNVTYKGTKTVSFGQIEMAVGKKGKASPLEPGKKCVYTGGKKPGKAKLLVLNGDTAVIEWTYSVPVKDVAVIGHTGGWEEVFPKEKYIY